MRYRYIKKADGSLVRSAQIWTAEEHNIAKSDVDPLAVYICNKLSNEGYETYIVGGAVRDLLLKKVPKDFDIASAATPSRIKKIFNNSRIIGKRFRLVHVFFGDKIFEIATFRSMQNGASDNTFGKIEEDVMRRDFTMNALFYDPQKEFVVDFVGGFEDIKNQRIKPLIPVSTIFTEDPVRMLRAVKYAVISGFSLPFALRQKIKKSASELKRISPSRLTEEMGKILKSPHAAAIIEQFEEHGLYLYLQPKASKLIRSSSNFRRRYFEAFAQINADGEEYADAINGGLRAMIRDYIEDSVDWKKANEESYKSAFIMARKFILPINPPRIELSRAMRDIFASHGLKIHRWRCLDRNRRGD
ncbi:MAG: polynucleotide adenylyltransferase PcnB [Spirochaetaceae bacterium]|nr:polynucleotide adenylyltransferase PcnB [Spirochaetaceae bacterium]